jgi:hypothetical protein
VEDVVSTLVCWTHAPLAGAVPISHERVESSWLALCPHISTAPFEELELHALATTVMTAPLTIATAMPEARKKGMPRA